MIELINLSWIVGLLGICALLVVPAKFKASIATLTVMSNSIVTSWLAIQALIGKTSDFIFFGGNLFGDIAIRVDKLSAWFILIINFTCLTGVFFGSAYLKVFKESAKKMTFHWILFVLFQLSMIGHFLSRFFKHF
jgi:formate hydrogenlyase subunit 3/multisubunit Na+/H+ antiporter MnhD subunit